ncbi:MAG: SWIM zinc finger family protein [Acidilobaceae archaeon]
MQLAIRVIFTLAEIAGIEVGRDYKPTSYLYSYYKKRDNEGVFLKGLKLKDKVKIVKVTVDGEYSEIIARVPSENSTKEYRVKIILPLDFECTCPYQQHHFNPCKHVYATMLKILELNGAPIEDWRLQQLVYEGLNKYAYIKAKNLQALT